jgi:hypothetical protein
MIFIKNQSLKIGQSIVLFAVQFIKTKRQNVLIVEPPLYKYSVREKTDKNSHQLISKSY